MRTRPEPAADMSGMQGNVKTAEVLVVEDEGDVRRLVRVLLERAGHTVVEAANGLEALRLLDEDAPDLVVLDVAMPELDGWQTLERIRDLTDVPVLILTARAGELDKVRGLRGGADDYVTKPFGRQELLARVEALLRRRPPADRHLVIKFSGVEVDLDRQTVVRSGHPIDVSPQEFKVLRLFLTSSGRALSRDDILARCWGAEYEGTPRTVDNFVRSLRVKLELNAEEPRHFLTVRGHGYRFER